MLVADLDHVDGPIESRLVGVSWVAAADEHAPRRVHPALEVVVHVLASAHFSFFLSPSAPANALTGQSDFV